MTDRSHRDVDSQLEESMDLFQRADVGQVEALTPATPSRVLMAFDGSGQDQAVLSLAKQIHERCGSELAFCLASETAGEDRTGELREGGAQAGAVESNCEGETAYDRILSAVESSGADFLIVPCPFDRDYESIGEDSTGTVIDVLIARCCVPFVAIRRPVSANDDPTKHLRLVFTGENHAALTAARCAAGLVNPSGKIDMLLLVESSFYDNFRAAMHAIAPAAHVSYADLEHALARSYGRLHAALHHTAAELKFDYELLIHNELDEAPVTPGDPKTHPALIVLGLDQHDHDSQSEVHDYIRRSPHPVLVCPVNQPKPVDQQK